MVSVAQRVIADSPRTGRVALRSFDQSRVEWDRSNDERETDEVAKLRTQGRVSRPACDEMSARGSARVDGTRREEILGIAASLFASSGYLGCSLNDVSQACGILPGSLYHHFDSKEAIAVELVERYHADLESLGKLALTKLEGRGAAAVFDDIVTLARALAKTSVDHRAALQLTLYEPPSGAGARLVELAQWHPENLRRALDRLLRRARTAGLLQAGISPLVVAEQIYTCMRRLAIPVSSDPLDAERSADTLCHMLLGGIAEGVAPDNVLDASAAMAAANESVRVWEEEAGEPGNDKEGLVLAVARSEFARRGYEATTIRDIASAAGLATGTVYRFVDSKSSLLTTIMGAYYNRLSRAYRDVLSSGSGIVEQIDALVWVNINSLRLFPDEFEIQHSWFREVPPDGETMQELQAERTAELSGAVGAALVSGDLRLWNLPNSPAWREMFVTSLHSLIWTPPDIVQRLGNRKTHAYVRKTVLRGATPLGDLDQRDVPV